MFFLKHFRFILFLFLLSVVPVEPTTLSPPRSGGKKRGKPKNPKTPVPPSDPRPRRAIAGASSRSTPSGPSSAATASLPGPSNTPTASLQQTPVRTSTPSTSNRSKVIGPTETREIDHSAALAVIRALHSNTPARDAVLTMELELDDLEEEVVFPDAKLKILYELFDKLSSSLTSNLDRVELDGLFDGERVVSAMYESLLDIMSSKLPSVPSELLVAAKEPKKGAVESSDAVNDRTKSQRILKGFDNLAIKLKKNLHVMLSGLCSCNCKEHQMLRVQRSLCRDDTMKGLMKDMEEKLNAPCPNCRGLRKLLSKKFTLPNIPSFSDRDFQVGETTVLNEIPHKFHGAILRNKETKRFCYLSAEDSGHLKIFHADRKPQAYSPSQLKTMKEEGKFETLLVQYIALHDHRPICSDIVPLLQRLADPPVRIRNILGFCALNSVANALLLLPKEIRQRIRNLEVPEGCQPHRTHMAPFHRFSSPLEELIQPQRNLQWSVPMPFPPALVETATTLGLVTSIPDNELYGLRMTGGIFGEQILQALFRKLANRPSFRQFAQYTRLDKTLATDPFRGKALNIVALPSTEKRQTEKKVGQLTEKYAKGDTLILVIMEPGHAALVAILPCGTRIYISDDEIKKIEGDEYDQCYVDGYVLYQGDQEVMKDAETNWGDLETAKNSCDIDFIHPYYIQPVNGSVLVWKENFREALVFRKNERYECQGRAKAQHNGGRCSRTLAHNATREDFHDAAAQHASCWKRDGDKATRSLKFGDVSWSQLVRQNLDGQKRSGKHV